MHSMGRGESWAFDRLAAETRVSLGGQLLLWEPLVLDNTEADAPAAVGERMGGFECFCLVVLMGPRMEPVIEAVSQTQGRPTFQQRMAANLGSSASAAEQLGRQRCITSLCRLLDDSDSNGRADANGVNVGKALALKVAGRATEDVAGLLASLLAPLESVVGTRPYVRR